MPAGGIWKSRDGGQTWTDLGLSYRGVNAISLDPAKQAIYCGLANAGVAVATPGGAGIPAVLELLLLDYKSASGGKAERFPPGKSFRF